MSSANRPDIDLALDIRSNERVFVVCDHGSRGYPDSWIQARSEEDLVDVGSDCVVLVDRIDPWPGLIADLGLHGPRLIALVPRNVDQEKAMRRMTSAMYPWSELWTVSTSFGKLLVTKDVTGRPYDREYA